MKKLVSIAILSFVMLFGIQTVSAQTDAELARKKPEVIAKSQVADFSKKLELNGDQQRAIFRAIVAKEVNYQKHVTGKDLNSKDVIANKAKFDNAYEATMKKILTEKQFAIWKKMQNN